MTSRLAQLLALLTITSLFSACGSGNSQSNQGSATTGTGESSSSSQPVTASLLDRDMTGTWQIVTKSKQFNLQTQEHTRESGYSRLIFIEDRSEGIRDQRCFDHIPDQIIYGGGHKTQKYYYQWFDTYYELLEGGNLFREYSEVPFSDEELGLREDHEEYMIQISDDFITQSGTFLLTSPIDFNESTHTCSEAWYGQAGQVRGVSIIFPFKDESAGLRLEFRGPIELGTYTYETEYNSTTPIRVSLYYSEKFDEELGLRLPNCYYDDMKNISIEITVFDDERITGSFAFDKEKHCYDDDDIEQAPELIYVEGEFDISLEHLKVPSL